MENKRPTQTDRVIQYMRDFGSITQMEALNDLGIMRLASRMSEVKQRGIRFDKTMETVTNRYGEKVSYARYRLVDNG